MERIDINPIEVEAIMNLCEKNSTGIKIGSKLMEEF
jgi:hypothetical protein